MSCIIIYNACVALIKPNLDAKILVATGGNHTFLALAVGHRHFGNNFGSD